MKHLSIAGLTVLSILIVGSVIAAPSALEADMKKLSVEQIMSKAKATVAESRNMLEDSFKLLKKSLSENKATEVLARRDAITIMRGLLKVSEENLQTLQQEAAEGDREGVEREYVKIVLAKRRISEYYAEVKSAEGTLNMQVDVEVTPTFLGALPPDNSVPTQFIEVDPIPDPPVSASPYN